MANFYIGANLADQPTAIVPTAGGTITGGKNVEVVVNATNVTERAQVVIILSHIIARLLEDKQYPPA